MKLFLLLFSVATSVYAKAPAPPKAKPLNMNGYQISTVIEDQKDCPDGRKKCGIQVYLISRDLKTNKQLWKRPMYVRTVENGAEPEVDIFPEKISKYGDGFQVLDNQGRQFTDGRALRAHHLNCKDSNECVLEGKSGCCPNAIAVNKKSKDFFKDDSGYQLDCSAVTCSVPKYKASCYQNRCVEFDCNECADGRCAPSCFQICKRIDQPKKGEDINTCHKCDGPILELRMDGSLERYKKTTSFCKGRIRQ